MAEVDLLHLHNNQEVDLLLSYKGPMDKYFIKAIGEYINEITIDCMKARVNFYKVFMELVQNVAFYSLEYKKYRDENTIGIGSLALYRKDEFLFLQIGNRVNIQEIDPIIKKCKKINTLNRLDLRKFKRQERARPYSSQGGGNIGLIQVALDSDNPLDFELAPFDNNEAFFSVCVKIKCR